jgi:hypothetical protein
VIPRRVAAALAIAVLAIDALPLDGRLQLPAGAPLLANRLVPVKPIVIGSRSARLYSTVRGELALETDRRGGTVAMIGPTFAQGAFFFAIGHLRHIPRG